MQVDLKLWPSKEILFCDHLDVGRGVVSVDRQFMLCLPRMILQSSSFVLRWLVGPQHILSLCSHPAVQIRLHYADVSGGAKHGDCVGELDRTERLRVQRLWHSCGSLRATVRLQKSLNWHSWIRAGRNTEIILTRTSSLSSRVRTWWWRLISIRNHGVWDTRNFSSFQILQEKERRGWWVGVRDTKQFFTFKFWERQKERERRGGWVCETRENLEL